MKAYVALKDISLDNDKGESYWIPAGTVYFPENGIKLKKGDCKYFLEEEFLYMKRVSNCVQSPKVKIVDIPDAMVQLLLYHGEQITNEEKKFNNLRADLYELIRNNLDGIL